MGAVVLITLGVLFLLDKNTHFHFHQNFPILLLVIGAVLLVSRTGSTEGHVNPQWYTAQMPPQNPQQWTGGAVAPPPPVNSSTNPSVNPPMNPNDPQVNP
jgi:hypothetical protein